MKTEIINEIDSLIQLSKDLDNAYMKNKLRDIKKLLLKEWNESDNNLNNLMHFKIW